MLAALAGATATLSATQSARAPSEACAAFAPTLKDRDASVTGVTYETTQDVRGSVCVVRGKIASAPTSTIHFRVDLPAAALWNTKLEVR